jgi:putative transposase
LEARAARALVSLARIGIGVGCHTRPRALAHRSARVSRRDLVSINRFFPSTRMCSARGVVGNKRALHTRRWICDACGLTHDRDGNASQNMLAAAHAVRAEALPRRWPVEGAPDAPSVAGHAAPMKQELVA